MTISIAVVTNQHRELRGDSCRAKGICQIHSWQYLFDRPAQKRCSTNHNKMRILQSFQLQRIIELCAILFLIALTSHCTLIGIQKDTNLYTVYMRYEDLKSPGFHKEITRLQAITEKPQDTHGRAMIHLQLALLYSHYENPTPNYHRALKELETYVSLYPEGGKADVIQNWLTMLKEIVKLSMENKDMKEKLEQLQNLDIELEKTRKLLK
jgi:hypothetical protein